jgi:hypothetical protein
MFTNRLTAKPLIIAALTAATVSSLLRYRLRLRPKHGKL